MELQIEVPHSYEKNDFVRRLIRAGVLKDDRIIQVVSSVDRSAFADCDFYSDLTNGSGDVVLHIMHGFALETLKNNLRPGHRVLVVGTGGAGYLPACMGLLVGDSGQVIGIDNLKSRVDLSIANIHKDRRLVALLEKGRLKLITGDGRLGQMSLSPYDAIYVDLLAPYIPQLLIDQLRPGGKLLFPVKFDDAGHTLQQVDKNMDESVSKQNLTVVTSVRRISSARNEWSDAKISFDYCM